MHRERFTDDSRLAVIAAQGDVADRLALRLLFDYGIRKGALQKVQFKHFDHNRKRLTIFTKGGKIREIPVVSPEFWHDLGRQIIDVQAEPHHYLLCRRKAIPRKKLEDGSRRTEIHRFPDQPMGGHGLHNWWYDCLRRAGLVDQGVSRGERMHKARYTAGQRVLDKTGNLKAVQKLLGHASITTTADIYVDWDLDQLADTMRDVLEDGPRIVPYARAPERLG